MKITKIFLVLNAVCVVHGIYGGEKLSKNDVEFPWLVAFHHKSLDQFFCAGSLISAKHVLSGTFKFAFFIQMTNFW